MPGIQALQNFQANRPDPAITADWLNLIDKLNIFNFTSVVVYGADPTGVLDSTAAIQACFASGNQNIIVPAGTYSVSNVCEYAVTNHTNPSIIIFQGQLQANANFPSNGGYVFNCSGSNVLLYNPNIDGGIVGGASGTSCIANGINVAGGRIRIYGPSIVHFPTIGLYFGAAGGLGDSYAYDVCIEQWSNYDAAWGTQANYTADGIRFDRADCSVFNGTVRWCKNQVHWTANTTDCWLMGVHVYHGLNIPGTGNGPAVDPINLLVDVGASSVYIHNCIIDDGHGDFYSASVSFLNNQLLQTSKCTFTQDTGWPSSYAHFIRFFAGKPSPGDEPYQLSFKNTSGYMAGITYYNVDGSTTLPMGFGPYGSNIWTGSYAALDSLQGSSTFQDINCSNGQIFIQGNTVGTNPPNRAASDFIKPNGVLYFTYRVGNNPPITMTYSTPASPGVATQTIAADLIEVVPVNGLTAGLYLKSSAGNAGTAAIRLDNTAVTASKTPDGTVIPINIDGTVKYIQLCT